MSTDVRQGSLVKSQLPSRLSYPGPSHFVFLSRPLHTTVDRRDPPALLSNYCQGLSLRFINGNGVPNSSGCTRRIQRSFSPLQYRSQFPRNHNEEELTMKIVLELDDDELRRLLFPLLSLTTRK